SLDVARAIVETAHQHGVPVVSHAIYEDDVTTAIEAGVDQIAHIAKGSIPLATLQMAADLGITWVPTLAIVGPSGSSHLKHFFEMGGAVAMGTDDGAVRFPAATMPIEELRRMLRSGMTTMSVIVASTRNAALACGLDHVTGTLEVGKRADILAVAGDPLQEIETLGEPLLVMHRGVIIRDERE
ncbi:amidohydrolase family protein, partial [Candidatus Bipolaricaulota bacterium]